ncbi:MAG: long-chain fatty acid--CoA ligase, partial [Synergistaceae bacterium]|nr:long-chain fatty acid--CoA ligase [Synergistaceae bacterium]
IARRFAEDRAQKVIWWKGAWQSAEEVERKTALCAAALEEGDFQPGSRLAVFLPNCPLVLYLSMAAWRLGGTIVPLNPGGGAEWILKILNHVDPFAVVAGEGMKEAESATVAGGLPLVSVSPDGVIASLSGRTDRPDQDPDVAVIFATSGTTGAPKAVPLTHGNLFDNTRGVHETIEGFDRGRVLMNVLPNFHSFGYTVCGVLPLLWGLPEALLPGFLPLKNLFEGLRASDTGILIAVPTMLPFILGAVSKGETLPGGLRYILTGGGKLDPSLEKRFRDQLGVITFEGYGLTECSPVVSCNPSDAVRKTGTVGPPLPGYSAEVRGRDGNALPAGEEGVLWLKGPSVAKGYFRDPEQTAARFKDGWLNTDDMVRMDEDGYITILDRASDMIIVGGFNVYPQEVETVIKELPGVREAVVIGMENPVSGEVPVAFIIPEDGAELDASAVISHCKGKMAHFKVPRKVSFVDELPMSAAGKVLKRSLREGLGRS